MRKLDKFKENLYLLVVGTPIVECLPAYPWEGGDWDEVVSVILGFINNNREVLDDEDPFVEWLERYQFSLINRS